MASQLSFVAIFQQDGSVKLRPFEEWMLLTRRQRILQLGMHIHGGSRGVAVYVASFHVVGNRLNPVQIQQIKDAVDEALARIDASS